jgi:succinyl-CoA synthetase beta subunit
LKLFEHEAKDIISTYEVPTPKGELATTRKQAREVAARLAGPVVVKAQLLVAGRGKAGGILFADDPTQAEEAAAKLLGAQIKDQTVAKVLVEEKLLVKKELFFGITVDRFNRCYVAAASPWGGVDIEEVAKSQPQKIYKQPVNPQLGFRSFHARQMAKELGYSGKQMLELAKILEKMFKANVEYDAELLETNPLVETQDGKFVAADARFILDDNALFRHEQFKRIQLQEQRDLTTQEFEALKNGMDFVKLDGDIGVVGNGAGLVMATLDMIDLHGGKPANFLDIGGGAPQPRIEAALRIILSNPKVKVLFVNILGGITLCDEVARGIVQSLRQLGVSTLMVIRLVGTNEHEGRRILEDANFQVFDSMEEAAVKAVQLAKKEP